MKRACLSLIAAASLAASPAIAQLMSDCDWRAGAEYLAQPISENTRSFANGAVRVMVTDTVEPAAGSYHIVVVGPPYDAAGGSQCRLISYGAAGFAGVSLDRLQAEYDPVNGLSWQVPVEVYDAERDTFGPLILTFTLNQSTGVMTTYLAR